MNPTIQVTINPDGRNAKEIDWSVSGCSCIACIRIRERLRTFEIDFGKTAEAIKALVTAVEKEYPGATLSHVNYGYEPGTTHTAEILPNNKVKILS